MSTNALRGVIAAIVTPVTEKLDPDTARFVSFARHLLENGCDALNVCGTTGEATSLSVDQRKAVMKAAADSLPRNRLMVGTGAAATADAVHLTRYAAELGFAAALVLPPFYYKGVSDDGVLRYLDRIFEGTSREQIDVYLYNFPALSGVLYSPELIRRACVEFGPRLRGIKDSSGDMAYAEAVADLPFNLGVFPSTEAILIKARQGRFAGCISATANVNSAYCASAFHKGDEAALAKAVAIRNLLSAGALIPNIKTALGHLHKDDTLGRLLPPFVSLADAARAELIAKLEGELKQ